MLTNSRILIINTTILGNTQKSAGIPGTQESLRGKECPHTGGGPRQCKIRTSCDKFRWRGGWRMFTCCALGVPESAPEPASRAIPEAWQPKVRTGDMSLLPPDRNR